MKCLLKKRLRETVERRKPIIQKNVDVKQHAEQKSGYVSIIKIPREVEGLDEVFIEKRLRNCGTEKTYHPKYGGAQIKFSNGLCNSTFCVQILKSR